METQGDEQTDAARKALDEFDRDWQSHRDYPIPTPVGDLLVKLARLLEPKS